MSNFIDEVMGFNPQDLSVFNKPVANSFNGNVYKTNPSLSKAEDGHYRSKLRVIYNPFNLQRSIIPQATYAMHDINGFFMVKSKLGNGDKDCPIFKSWKRLWFSGDETKKEWAKKMYDKSESQWILVQILEDDNQPELVGQFKAMKLPRDVYDKMSAKMNPSPESKKTPIAVMDYLFGLPLEMDVVPGPDDPQNPSRKQREISYTLCEFGSDFEPIIGIDGKPLFTEAEIELLDAYNSAKNEIAKAKTQAKKDEKMKFLQEKRDSIKALYEKAYGYVKEHAINLEDECAYKDWDADTMTRVQHWIELVAQMKDPKVTTMAEPVAPAAPSLVIESATPAAPSPVDAMMDDDLPF